MTYAMMMNKQPRITLIHATPLSIAPIEQAFAAAWPQAELVNLLEDSLSRDRARDGQLTAAMCQRFETLADYAVDIGSDAILFTCSAFAGAIEQVQQKLSIPVLKPNEAMLEAALEHGGRLAIVATFPATIDSMTAELQEYATARKVSLQLQTRLANGAMQALAEGDAAHHDSLIIELARDIENVDAVLLAQFSMARARPGVEQIVSAPVLTSPDSAVRKLQRLLAQS